MCLSTGLLVLTLVVAILPIASARNLLVHFLNVGQGDATYIVLPDSTSILIDGGPDNGVLSALGDVMPWWDHRIDYIIVTHPDRDHFGGLLGVVEKYDVGAVLYADSGHRDDYFELFRSMVLKQDIPLYIIEQGYVLRWPSRVFLHVLWPPHQYQSTDDNAYSVVVLLTWGSTDILLAGDVGRTEEHELTTLYPRLTVDVLKVGHHGSNQSSGPLFLSSIKPKLCIISAGADNRYHHPHPSVRQRLRDASCLIRETEHEGTITVRSDGVQFSVAR